jgi:hypothetical protein
VFVQKVYMLNADGISLMIVRRTGVYLQMGADCCCVLLQIAAIHQLRLALSIKYVKLRNQRHRRVRQLLRQQQQQLPQAQQPSSKQADAPQPLEAGDSSEQQQQQEEVRMPGRMHSGVRLHHHSSMHQHQHQHHHQQQQLPSSAANLARPGLMALAAAAEGVVAANTLAHMAAAQSSGTATAGEAGGSSQPGSSPQTAPAATGAVPHGAHAAVADSPSQQQQQQQVVLPTSGESDLATLQYMAFVYARHQQGAGCGQVPGGRVTQRRVNCKHWVLPGCKSRSPDGLAGSSSREFGIIMAVAACHGALQVCRLSKQRPLLGCWRHHLASGMCFVSPFSGRSRGPLPSWLLALWLAVDQQLE